MLICSTSPPGGNQVDGLPPASSLKKNDKLGNFGRKMLCTQSLNIYFQFRDFFNVRKDINYRSESRLGSGQAYTERACESCPSNFHLKKCRPYILKFT